MAEVETLFRKGIGWCCGLECCLMHQGLCSQSHVRDGPRVSKLIHRWTQNWVDAWELVETVVGGA